MGILFNGNFDYMDTPQVAQVFKQANTSGSYAVVANGGRWGGRYLNMPLIGTGIGCACPQYGNLATVGCSIAMKIVSFLAGSNIIIFRDETAATNQFDLRLDTLNRFYFTRSTGAVTILGPSVQQFRANTWYMIEILGTVNNAAGSLELRIDGEVILTGTGLNTRSSANSWSNVVFARCPPTSHNLNIGDFLVWDTIGRAHV